MAGFGRSLPICPVSRKFGFESRRAARRRLHAAQGDPTFHGKSVYRCPDCGNWHITSQPPREVPS